jgi:DNA repair protein RAD5
MLKLRRIGVLHLFHTIGLQPLQSSAMTRLTANAREQLVMAVQVSEQSTKGSRMSRSSSSLSASSDEEGEGKEVAEDTLNLLYKKAQMYDPDMPTVDPPDTFKFDLRKYQKQALCWMIAKESGSEEDIRKQQSLNPLWEEYAWPQDDSVSTGKENQDTLTGDVVTEKFYLNPYSGEMSLTFPTYKAIHKGGILADGLLPVSSYLNCRNGSWKND